MALGILIWRPPWSPRNVKSAVNVFGDICQASLLHLTMAAVSCVNFFSGHVITGPEKARRGARVHSTNLRLFSIERSLFLRKKQAISVIPSMTYRLCAALSSHMLYRQDAQESDWQQTMDDLQVCSFVFDSCWLPHMLAFQARWGGGEVCW